MSYSIDFPFTTEVKQHLSQYCNVHNFSSKENCCEEEKYLVSYNKQLTNFNDSSDKIGTIGLLRSTIFLNGKLVSFSPPKAIPFEDFSKKYNIGDSNVVVEDFVEGTMINLYFNFVIKKWEISTKNNIGGNNHFYEDNPYSFAEMFNQTLSACYLNLDELNTNYCYSFVMKHPLNDLITLIGDKPQLYLIEVYYIEHINENYTKITIINKNEHIKTIPSMSNVFIPYIFDTAKSFDSFDCLFFTDIGVNIRNYSNMGFMIKNTKTGERTKIRNPHFEKIQILKGNQTNSLYNYLSLRKQNKLNDFLHYFPEKNLQYSNYTKLLYEFTDNLYQYYLLVNIYKSHKLNECDLCYKNHIYKLHEYYINGIKNLNKIKINKKFVIDYVNNLDTTVLFKSLKKFLNLQL